MTVLAAGSLGAGLTAFLVVVVLVVACVFLFRSMSKHLRKVPKSFDDTTDKPVTPAQRDHDA
jgi:hypothetical protein